MPLFKAEVIETVARRYEYLVEAVDRAEAEICFRRGETITSVFLGDEEVLRRDVDYSTIKKMRFKKKD